MKFSVQLDDLSGSYKEVVKGFEQEAGRLGARVERGRLLRPRGGSFEHSTVLVAIDPQTVKLIFEYLTATIVTAKAGSYFGDFFKAAVRKAGESVGSEVVGLLARLWKKVWERNRTTEQDPVYMGFEFQREGPSQTITAFNGIALRSIPERKAEQSLVLLMTQVLPFVEKLREKATAQRIDLGSIEVMLQEHSPRIVWSVLSEALNPLLVDGTASVRSYDKLFPLADVERILNMCRSTRAADIAAVKKSMKDSQRRSVSGGEVRKHVADAAETTPRRHRSRSDKKKR